MFSKIIIFSLNYLLDYFRYINIKSHLFYYINQIFVQLFHLNSLTFATFKQSHFLLIFPLFIPFPPTLVQKKYKRLIITKI